MSQTFDTGLSGSQRTVLRAAVIAKLAPMLRANGRYLAAIAPVARTLRGGDDDTLAMMDMALQGRFPSVLVALAGKTYDPTTLDRDSLLVEFEVAVYVAAKNPRDLVVGRLSPDVVSAGSVTADPGIETMLEHVEQLLVGEDLGVAGIYEMWPHAETEVFTGAEYSMWEQSYRVKCDRVIETFRGPLETSISTAYNLDGGNAGNPIITTITQLAPEVP